MDYKKRLADIVRQERIKRCMTQLELADTLGLSLRTITDIENHRGNPRYDTLCDIIMYLHLDANEIFYPEKNEDPLLTSSIRLLRLFSKDARKAAYDMLEGLWKGGYSKH